MRRFPRVIFAVVAAALVAGATSATAAKPVIEHVRVSGVSEEAGAFLTALCGFDVVVFEEVVATERFYADGSMRATVNERITYTAGEQQLFEHNTFQFFFDAGQQISRFTGVPFRIVDETGRVIFKDRGNVAFDADGEILWEHGPHPSLHDPGPPGGICRDLSE